MVAMALQIRHLVIFQYNLNKKTMASAQVIITITDTPSHSLVQIREALLIKWNYLAGGGINWTPTGTANDKLLFIQAYTAKNWFKKEYKEQLQMISQAANEAADVDIQ